jgi:Osmosensitive K+ channel His kinase sensor domain
MNVDALIERKPQIALIDELAHTNIPGAKRAKRWEDVIDTLAAGIEVITTINIQHLESLNDVISNVTGIRQQETVPDWLFDLADRVELVDMSPHVLRRRIAHGNVYPGKLLTHRWLLERVWGAGYREDVEVLRVFISQLRKKVEPLTRPRVIVTDPGVGYRWSPDVGALTASQTVG